ncbi:MAG: diaminopimelate decarboxylase [Limnochordaceae bacterium]|nr:diaminopimelate decarboxylase [Limnochordaceae bacterium]
MAFPFPLTVNPAGHLVIGGVDALELAEQFGTPLYVVDEQVVRDRCRRYREALEPVGGLAVYAAKAFWTGGMAQVVRSEGLGADVSSEAEWRLAMLAGLDASRLVLHGNNKSPAELRLAAEGGVGRIVVDSLWELDELERVAASSGARKVPVLLRLLPDIRAGAHGSIQTGHRHSKFGIPIEGGQAREAVRRCLASARLDLRGYHVHIGSQILSLEPYRQAARVVAGFAIEMARQLDAPCYEVDMGGGLGVRYVAGDEPPAIEDLIEALAETLEGAFTAAGMEMPLLIVEPGRSIIAEAGITLYRVGAIKRLAGGEIVCAVDGGMSDNPRVALYQARYTAVLARDPYGTPAEAVEIAGRLCESGDVLVDKASLPEVRPGDVVALLTTGAYHHSMASNYNGLPKPAVVTVREGQARLWVRRERFEDQYACDALVQALGANRSL